MAAGAVQAIFTSPAAGAAPEARAEVQATPGRGLAGDRYFDGIGTYSDHPGPDREVTLIAAEVLDELVAAGLALAPGEHRRNVVTSGVALNPLVGQEFAVGDVKLRGVRLCEPCDYLAKLTGKAALLPALVHRGGLRAQVLTPGTLRVGAPVRIIP